MQDPRAAALHCCSANEVIRTASGRFSSMADGEPTLLKSAGTELASSACAERFAND